MRTLCSLALVAVGFGCDCGGGDGGGADGGSADGPAADAGPQCFTWATVGAEGEGSPPPDGVGGEGDIEVRTDVLRAVFAAVDRPVHLAPSGGTLVDLHLLGRDDHLNEISQLAGVSQEMQVAYTEMEVVEAGPGRFVLEARGHVKPQPGEPSVSPDPGTDLSAVTRYELRCGEPRLWMETTITNVGEQAYGTETAFGVLDVVLWGGNSLLPFCPTRGHGDRCPAFDIDRPLATLVESPYVGSTGSVIGTPGSFALYIDDPIADAFIGVHGDQVSAIGFFDPFGGAEMAPGDTRSLRRAITLGDRADAASATDVALDALAEEGRMEVGTVTGTVTPPPGEALADDPYRRPLVVLARPGTADPLDPATWTPLTMARVDEDGSLSARVPAGEVAWELRMPGALPQRGAGGTVAADGTLDLGTIEAEPLPLLQVQVRDVTGGSPAPLPARVVVRGAEGTEDPVFGPRYGGSPAGQVVLTDGMGDAEVRIPPGTYDVYATHGPRYTLARERVVVEAGADVAVSLDLSALEVIPEGFLTADFHVHSGASFDSSLPIPDRVRAFLAEGVDAVVSTEHDVIFDYAPALAAIEETLPLAWQGRLRTFVGLESTAFVPQPDFAHTTGHHNAFPLSVLDGAHKNGAPNDEFLDVGTLYERLRALPSPVSEPLVQLNHGRASRSGTVWLGYFDSCGFDPTMALEADGPCFGYAGPMGTRPWDFDAMEVVNGPSDPESYLQMSRDWYALLRQAPGGRHPIGTANGDSHNLVTTAGYPVTVLRTDTDLTSFDEAALTETVRSGAVAGSLGVFAWATATETGGTDAVEPGRAPLAAPSGNVTLDVRVAAAPWIPVAEIRIRANGEIVARLSAAGGDWTEPSDPFGTEGVVRFADTVEVTVAADAFLTIEAGFPVEAGAVGGDPPELLDVVVPGARPIAFTNPIYVDVDGGGYTPIGTPLPE